MSNTSYSSMMSQSGGPSLSSGDPRRLVLAFSFQCERTSSLSPYSAATRTWVYPNEFALSWPPSFHRTVGLPEADETELPEAAVTESEQRDKSKPNTGSDFLEAKTGPDDTLRQKLEGYANFLRVLGKKETRVPEKLFRKCGWQWQLDDPSKCGAEVYIYDDERAKELRQSWYCKTHYEEFRRLFPTDVCSVEVKL